MPAGVAAAPGGRPKPRSAADAEVGTGIPAPGPNPGSPGIPGCGPIAALGGSCWACICCRSLGRSGLCCCRKGPKFNVSIKSFTQPRPDRYLAIGIHRPPAVIGCSSIRGASVRERLRVCAYIHIYARVGANNISLGSR